MSLMQTMQDAHFRVRIRIACIQHCSRCFIICVRTLQSNCVTASSMVLCAHSTGSQVHLHRVQGWNAPMPMKNIWCGSIGILALTVLEYSKYDDSHSYWIFNNNNKQIEETKRFGKYLFDCIRFACKHTFIFVKAMTILPKSNYQKRDTKMKAR